jgi:hypothetical protein
MAKRRLAKYKTKSIRMPRPSSGKRWMVWTEHDGGPSVLDKKIALAVGQRCTGSGYSFYNDTRDLSFVFATRPGALHAAARARRIRGVRARIIDQHTDH